ncbi:MAG: Cytochrome c biogenesis protein CcsA [Bacteroidetes bacterium ADurb.Bin145]|nr:MAG: Cytochrome c biogenesis protein CcsA [Bacteroidetes bacterium ADurb.Bin145]
MGSLFIVFAVAMAAATFIENDYGSPAAYSMVYGSKWFELVLLLLALNLAGQVLIFKLLRKKKITIALFHLSFILILTGAGITRYFGWEGTMRIREGETSGECYSGRESVRYAVSDESGKILKEGSEEFVAGSASSRKFSESITTDGHDYTLRLDRTIPNATEDITTKAGGDPLISLLVVREGGEGEIVVLKDGGSANVDSLSFGFNSGSAADIQISFESGEFFMSSPVSSLGEMNMMTKEAATVEPGEKVSLKEMQVISVSNFKIVTRKMVPEGINTAAPVSVEEMVTGKNALIFEISSGMNAEQLVLWDKQSEEVSSASASLNGLKFEITYGAEIVNLPFSLKLNDFILERYPGSDSPSGYRSEVTLIDKERNAEKPYSIFMNNILKYEGYRLYQSSFDEDEKGTVLSVSRDQAGIIVTYSGYALLFLFIILSLVNRNSLFHTIRPEVWYSSLRKTAVILPVLLLISSRSQADANKFVPSREASEEFGKVLVQDQKGRTEPLFTLSNDILRKVTGSNSFEKFNSMQVFLGLYFDFENWKDIPLIKVANKNLRKQLGISGEKAAFSDLVDLEQGRYALSDKINDVYSKSPGARNKTEKEMLKLDERVNIVYMIRQGTFMKIFPLRDGSLAWGPVQEALKTAAGREDSAYLEGMMSLLPQALMDRSTADIKNITASLSEYQKRFAGYTLPASSKLKAELFYYKAGIFEKLFPFYATTGVLLIIILIIMVIRGSMKTSFIIKLLKGLLFAAFFFHTAGLGIRWYISGHSPMSNGYESLIFISWVTMLAGLIFSRKSSFTLSATAVLSGLTLMVAHLSFMDPEITNLVPVLQSYWLTLHVSIITGSYGFLGLGFILGLLTMILLSFLNGNNRERISDTIDELTIINYRSLTLGLYLLTIGTFLGAIWANESWGRYWGWDPKETWSLITIIVYSLVIHSKQIPGMKDIYTFNVLALFAFSSVLMTYFGVNFYLSGLHSYASGDPVPVPGFVYITVIALAAVSIAAYVKYTAVSKKSLKPE